MLYLILSCFEHNRSRIQISSSISIFPHVKHFHRTRKRVNCLKEWKRDDNTRWNRTHIVTHFSHQGQAYASRKKGRKFVKKNTKKYQTRWKQKLMKCVYKSKSMVRMKMALKKKRVFEWFLVRDGEWKGSTIVSIFLTIDWLYFDFTSICQISKAEKTHTM